MGRLGAGKRAVGGAVMAAVIGVSFAEAANAQAPSRATESAGPWTFNRLVRLPGALPFFFTGLRQASSLAVIAAVVSEYFGGLQDGLGSRITSAAANTAYPRAWAFVVGACVLGLLFYVAALIIERLATPWRRTQ